MPGRDKTGPLGAGPGSGRGLGLCFGPNATKRGAGLGLLGLSAALVLGYGLKLFLEKGFLGEKKSDKKAR